jgi:gamma-tubulin complex component 2
VKKLLKAGCQPYFAMLEKWLCEGDLDDPFHEFMICQDPVSCSFALAANSTL